MRRPKLARDTVWLASSDGLAIIFGLIGQVILAKALLQSEYGLLVVILDAFATMYILIDAGLPTIIARDVRVILVQVGRLCVVRAKTPSPHRYSFLVGKCNSL